MVKFVSFLAEAEKLNYPTLLHAEVAHIVQRFFANFKAVDTVLLLNSCARGKGTKQSDLDIAVLLKADEPEEAVEHLEAKWKNYAHDNDAIQAFEQMGAFTKVHLDVINGRYAPPKWDDGGGPDGFELEIGNHIAYSVPIADAGASYRALRQKWLPYYDDGLRADRMRMVKQAALYDLSYIPALVERGLIFQAFDRLYKAEQEFLQLLMIQKRRYPIAYNKWIQEQLVDWLNMNELFAELQNIIAVRSLAGENLLENQAKLKRLIDALYDDEHAKHYKDGFFPK